MRRPKDLGFALLDAGEMVPALDRAESAVALLMAIERMGEATAGDRDAQKLFAQADSFHRDALSAAMGHAFARGVARVATRKGARDE